MTYYLKYLKYKNKYLELKKLIGGDPLNRLDLHKLFTQEEKKTFDVTNDELKKYLIKYCWIGFPEEDSFTKNIAIHYQNGFFIFLINTIENYINEIKKLGFKIYEQKGFKSYAVWMINPEENIGNIEEILGSTIDVSLFDKKNSPNIFKTSTQIGELPPGTKYIWNHDLNSWIFKNGNKYYKAALKAAFNL
jgi:hypothetical protein